MKFFIKEWPDTTATLMTEHGQVIWTFSSMQAAIKACAEWAGDKNQMSKLPGVSYQDRINTAA
ncbi:MAG: hypothetical protein ACYC9L_08340 [Sulfuricaulis sp.]